MPSPDFGPVSHFNAEGKQIIHKDRPKETAYRAIEWRWTEWHGQQRVEKTDFRDVPYERYPRTFVPPPSVEFTITATTIGESVLVTPVLALSPTNQPLLLHTVNLLLEIFREAQLLSENLERVIVPPIRRLHWRILPAGQRPWAQLKKELDPLIKEAPGGNQAFIRHRLEVINGYKPDFAAVGQAGFRGYIVLGFSQRKVYVLESLYYGNATYIFGEDWETLSKWTKAEILNAKLQKDRIVHTTAWDGKLRKIL